jgi:hypothetical protein
MSKILTQIKNTQTVRDIKAILRRSWEPEEICGQRQILEAHWEVGKYLTVDCPSGDNTRLIRYLAREFSQPTVYFHTAIKFYQCFPAAADIDDSVSWAEYKSLLNLP